MTDSKGVPYTQPYVCPRCRDEGNYTGILRFADGPTPQCRNHATKQDPSIVVEMIPISGSPYLPEPVSSGPRATIKEGVA